MPITIKTFCYKGIEMWPSTCTCTSSCLWCYVIKIHCNTIQLSKMSNEKSKTLIKFTFKKNTGKDFALFCNKSNYPFPTEWTLDQTPWTWKFFGASCLIYLLFFMVVICFQKTKLHIHSAISDISQSKMVSGWAVQRHAMTVFLAADFTKGISVI